MPCESCCVCPFVFCELFLVFGNIHVHVLLFFVDCLMFLTAGRPRQAQACPGMPRHHQGGWRDEGEDGRGEDRRMKEETDLRVHVNTSRWIEEGSEERRKRVMRRTAGERWKES